MLCVIELVPFVQQCSEVNTIFIPISQVRKLRYGKAQQLTQDSAVEWQSQGGHQHGALLALPCHGDPCDGQLPSSAHFATGLLRHALCLLIQTLL